MAANEDGDLLAYTFSTWVFQLHVDGVPADDDAVRSHCAAIMEATEAETGNAAAAALVGAVTALLSGDGPDAVSGAARDLFGDRVATDLGAGDRAERTHHIRQYQFKRQLPWLARIWERVDDSVVPTWLLIERVTDEVTAADPNPWNDIDEVRSLPLGDFHVLWELDACSSVYIS